MYPVAKLYPLSLALLLFACGKADPVDEEAATPMAAQAIQQASVPAAPGGLSWSDRPQDRAAVFGPPGSPAFSIQCRKPSDGRAQLIFVRYLPPTTAGNATLSFTGNGQAASVPVAAVINPGGVGGEWRATVTPDDNVRDVAEAFAGPGTVEVSVGGTPPLVVPAAAAPRRVLADCLSG